MSEALLPEHSSRLEKALEIALLERVTSIDFVNVLNPNTAPEPFLRWMAWALSVDEWDDGWSEDTKRETIRRSFEVHRLKGTRWAVRTALDAAGYPDAELIESFGNPRDGTVPRDATVNYEGADHWAEYRVKLTRPITVAQAAQVRRLLGKVAPARCHLALLDFREVDFLRDGTVPRDASFNYGVA
jgi:phage tail P2-like protein